LLIHGTRRRFRLFACQWGKKSGKKEKNVAMMNENKREKSGKVQGHQSKKKRDLLISLFFLSMIVPYTHKTICFFCLKKRSF